MRGQAPPLSGVTSAHQDGILEKIDDGYSVPDDGVSKGGDETNCTSSVSRRYCHVKIVQEMVLAKSIMTSPLLGQPEEKYGFGTHVPRHDSAFRIPVSARACQCSPMSKKSLAPLRTSRLLTRLSGSSRRCEGECTITCPTTLGVVCARLGTTATNLACGARDGEPAPECRLFLLTTDLFCSPFVGVAEVLWG